MRYSLLFAAGLLASLCSCAQRAALTSAAPATPASPILGSKPRTVSTIPIHTLPNDTALVFQRTPCYGTCPAYTAVVFRNGKVSYTGERFVPVTGPRALSLPQATVQEMVDQARAINFNGLEPSYHAQVTDLPATIVTSYLPGQRPYQVMAERGAAPTPLQGYIDYLASKLDPLAGLSGKQ